MNRWLWLWFVVSGFTQALMAVFVFALALRAWPDLTSFGLGLLVAAVLVTVGYGHLVFIALYLRRLQRSGVNLRTPKLIARFLARLLNGIQI